MNLSVSVCNATSSKAANTAYLAHRLPPVVLQPCTVMSVTTSLMAHTTHTKAEVILGFGEKIQVHKEVIPYSFTNLVAEVGGFIALILGVSFMDLPREQHRIKSGLTYCKATGLCQGGSGTA